MSYVCPICAWEGTDAPFDSKKANQLMGEYWMTMGMGSNFQNAYGFLVKNDDQNLKNFNFSLMTIKYYLLMEVHDDNKETVQMLATRLAFSAASAFTLALNGYYHNSMMIIRDIMEIGFLLDYFTYIPDAISDWRACDDQKRKNEYKANVLYQRLGKLEKASDGARRFIYTEYSKLFTHISPAFGFFTTKDNIRLTDPVLREEHLKFCLWELNLWTGFAIVVYLSNLFPKDERSSNSQIDKLISLMKEYLFEIEASHKEIDYPEQTKSSPSTGTISFH